MYIAAYIIIKFGCKVLGPDFLHYEVKVIFTASNIRSL